MPDNRELALLIVGTLFAVCGLGWPHTRGPALKVLQCIFLSRLAIVWGGALLWLAGWVAVLWHLEIWNPDLLKTTVLWCVFGGLLIAFQGIRATNPNRTFLQTIREQFRLLLFFELFINAYPLSLAWELVLLVTLSLLGILIAVAELDAANARVVKFLNGVISLIVIGLVLLTLWHLVHDPSQVFSSSGLQSFCAPIYLTLILLPYGYLFSVWSGYETLFLHCLSPHAMMPSRVRRYAKWRLILVCGLNANRARRAQHFIAPELRWATTREKVDAELDRLGEELAWDKQPAE